MKYKTESANTNNTTVSKSKIRYKDGHGKIEKNIEVMEIIPMSKL